MWKLFKAAWASARVAQRKQKLVDQLTGTKLNYGIIQDLVKSAEHGVVIQLTMTSGEVMTIRREEDFDELQKKVRKDLF